MEVYELSVEGVDESRSEDSHEAGGDDQIGPVERNLVTQRRAPLRAIRISARLDDLGRDPLFGGSREPGAGPVRNDRNDARVQLTRAGGAHESHHVRPRPRDQNDDAPDHCARARASLPMARGYRYWRPPWAPSNSSSSCAIPARDSSSEKACAPRSR